MRKLCIIFTLMLSTILISCANKPQEAEIIQQVKDYIDNLNYNDYFHRYLGKAHSVSVQDMSIEKKEAIIRTEVKFIVPQRYGQSSEVDRIISSALGLSTTGGGEVNTPKVLTIRWLFRKYDKTWRLEGIKK